MRLKREVQDLKKQVSRLKRKVKIYKWRAIKPKSEVSTAPTETGPIKKLFEGREFVLDIEIQKWQYTASNHKKEIARVQEQAVGVVTWYIDQLYKARLK